MQTTKIKEQDYGISFIRLFAMFLIITCHILQYYDIVYAWVLNVGVQIFLIVSGYLYGAKKIESTMSFIKKQFKKILIPYWVFLSLVCITYYIFHPYYLNIKNIILSYLSVDTMLGIEHLWFIEYILVCYAITPLLNIVRDKYINNANNLAIATLVTMACIEVLCIPLPLKGIYINCFVFGYFLKNSEKICTPQTINKLNNSIVCIAVIFNITRLMINTATINISMSINSWSHFLLGAAIFILLHKYAIIRKNNKALQLSDKYSYHIYLVHQFFILSPFTVLTITNFKPFNIAAVYIVSFIGGYLLYNICNIIYPQNKKLRS